MENQRVVAWFSCGAASAVAAKLAIHKYGDKVEVVYMDTGSEHPDSKRFMKDCEEWFDKRITVLKSDKYEDIWDVFEKTRFLVSPKGARCTTELKKVVGRAFGRIDDIDIYGYTLEEFTKKRPYNVGGKTVKLTRCENFERNNPEKNVEWILAENGMTKDDCKALLAVNGIDIPEMYKLGYKNNNCVGCVKGGKGYWNKIRVDFPEVFNRMALKERELGVRVLRDVWLSELNPKAGHYPTEKMPSCGITCGEVDIQLLV